MLNQVQHDKKGIEQTQGSAPTIQDLRFRFYSRWRWRSRLLRNTLTLILSQPTPRLRQAGRRGRGKNKGKIKTNYTNEKYPLTFPPQAGGNRREGEIYCVNANKVKQFHKSIFRLLYLPVRVRTQTDRSPPRNDNYGLNL